MPKSSGGKSYEHYDPKYNIYQDPQLEVETEPPGLIEVNYAQTRSSTILVIGIILVVIIAIILIIAIVFKMRTKSEVNQKVEQSKSFQGETEERPSSVSNGFHQKPPVKSQNNNNTATTTTSSSSKPVKEWYV